MKSRKLYVAICYNPTGSLRDNRSHTCWTGNTKKQITEIALLNKTKWEANGNGPYQIVVGTIEEVVEQTPSYTYRKF